MICFFATPLKRMGYLIGVRNVPKRKKKTVHFVENAAPFTLENKIGRTVPNVIGKNIL